MDKKMGVRGVKADTCIFFFKFDCEDIDAVYSEWKNHILSILILKFC